MSNARLRAAVIAAAAAASLGLAAGPMSAVAAPGHQTHHSAQVRAYDNSLLAHSNTARAANNRHAYVMSHRLWKIAHRWAKHLAKTGALAHNPHLVGQVSSACPNWTATGENVGVVYGTSATTLFQAYMHSPPHRANILDKRFQQVGIATVKVTRNGLTEQWDVMDFGTNCP
jgi:uncharacterized protein YkwD